MLAPKRSEYEGRPSVVGRHYHVQKKIGEGSFGVIHQGYNDLNQKKVAIKFENRKSVAPQLRDEHRTYLLLNGSAGVPTVYYYGQEPMYNCLVMDLLGPSLEELFDRCGRVFSVKTTCQVAIQMITRVQTIHEKGLIYRDIKPDNFLLGLHDNTIFIVDFGMAKYFRDPKTNVHIPYKEKKSLSGTARYMSISTHLGREQSRRDDLEALGHVFMYFLRGSLPWQGLKAATNKEKYEKIGFKKQETRISDLCAGFPEEFAEYLEYARSLAFEATPDYEYLKNLIRHALDRCSPNKEASYDWDHLRYEWDHSVEPDRQHYDSSGALRDPAAMNLDGSRRTTGSQGGTAANINSSSRFQTPPIVASPLGIGSDGAFSPRSPTRSRIDAGGIPFPASNNMHKNANPNNHNNSSGDIRNTGNSNNQRSHGHRGFLRCFFCF